MHVLDANEIFWMTFYTTDRILEEWGKNWPDALALYVKLIKQTRIQQTNQTYSLNSFLKDGMWWWTDRLRNAKNILKKLWLVEDVNLQDEKWRIIGHYVRVNYLIDEEKVRTAGMTYNLSTCWLWPQMDESHQWTPATCGWTATNALSTQYINAWSTQKEKERKNKKKEDIPTPSELVEAYNDTPALVQKINNEEVVREFAVYKQSTKRTAYKTVWGFIQKLIAYVNLVSYWEIRYDVWERLRYAVNEARDNWWIQLVRDDKTERGYQTVKKFISMTKKQDEH